MTKKMKEIQKANISKVMNEIKLGFEKYYNLVEKENEIKIEEVPEVPEVPEEKVEKNKVVASYCSYNTKRYGKPWVCNYNPSNQSHDFENKIGCYTATDGDEGDLVIYSPIEGSYYAYGQRDYRGRNTERNVILYKNGEFIAVDKIGRKI